VRKWDWEIHQWVPIADIYFLGDVLIVTGFGAGDGFAVGGNFKSVGHLRSKGMRL